MAYPSRTVRNKSIQLLLLLPLALAWPGTAGAQDAAPQPAPPVAAPPAQTQAGSSPVAVALQAVLAQPGNPPIGTVAIDRGLLKAFYGARNNMPAWIDAGGAPTPAALAAIALIDGASAEGLDPQFYHATAIDGAAKPQQPGDAANFDLLLSDGLAVYLHDVAVGRTPVGGDRDDSFPSQFDAGKSLGEVAALSPDDLNKYVAGLMPAEPSYAAARKALADFRAQQAAGGAWQGLPDGPSLKVGMEDAVVPALRQRLGLPAAESGKGKHPNRYDDALAGAVKAFQETHAIKDDGTLGHDTRAALNMPIEQRIAESMATMERLRWLPHDLGPRYLLVNVDGFWVRYAENGQTVLQLPVIVGTTKRETPLLASEVHDVVINPTWTVPPTIIKQDILPKLRADPDYLETRGIKLYRRGDSGLREVTPSEVDYRGGGEYVLRQPAGDENPLGRFKLQFPNKYSVYLHDTPEKQKFSAALRTFSSGCVRVQNVRQIVEKLLAGQDTPQQIDAFLAAEKTRTIPLEQPVPVFLDYLSVWDDGAGHTIFGPDLYNKDLTLAQSLQAALQVPPAAPAR